MARSWQSGELASSPRRLLKHVIPKEWREAICQPRSPGRVAQRQSKHVRWFVQRARDAGEEDAPCWRSDRTPLSPVVPPRIWLRLLCSGLCPVSPQVLWAELVSTASAPLGLFLEDVPPACCSSACPARAGRFAGGAAAHLYLVCWKQDQGVQPRQSEQWEQRPGKVTFWQAVEMFWAKEPVGCVVLFCFVCCFYFFFSPDQLLSSCGLLTPGGLQAALRVLRKGNRER